MTGDDQGLRIELEEGSSSLTELEEENAGEAAFGEMDKGPSRPMPDQGN